MIWMFCVTREEPELLTDIRDFSDSILRDFESSEWFESSMQSDLDMWFAILSHSRFCFLQTLFLV